MNLGFPFEESFEIYQPPLPCQSPIFRDRDLSQTSDNYERFSLSDLIFHEEEDQPNEPEKITSGPSLLPDEVASLLLERTKRILKKPLSPKKTPKKSPPGPKRNRTTWTADEDKILLCYQKKYGNQWARIAKHIPNREGKQVRERYLNVLSSNIVKKKPWTEEEDRIILGLLEEMGPQWCRIADALEGRSDTQVKNRYNLFLVKREIKGWSEEISEGMTAETSSKEVFDQYPVLNEEILLDFGLNDLDLI